jgi:hypothetical protein
MGKLPSHFGVMRKEFGVILARKFSYPCREARMRSGKFFFAMLAQLAAHALHLGHLRGCAAFIGKNRLLRRSVVTLSTGSPLSWQRAIGYMLKQIA